MREKEKQNKLNKVSELDETSDEALPAGDQQETSAKQASRRASAALLQRLKAQQQSGSSSVSARQAVQKFGRFKRQFVATRSYFHDYPNNNRFESDESWRPTEVFPESPVVIRTTFDEEQNPVYLAAAAAAAGEGDGMVGLSPDSSKQTKYKKSYPFIPAYLSGKVNNFYKPNNNNNNKQIGRLDNTAYIVKGKFGLQQYRNSQNQKENEENEESIQAKAYSDSSEKQKPFVASAKGKSKGESEKLTHEQQREIQQQLLNAKVTKAQHLQQYLSNDFGENTDRIFLLMKTGYSVQWERLPIHFLTTFTRFPNFAIYSDAASSIAGYEIIDILQDLPMSVLQDRQLGLYVEQQKVRRDHTYAGRMAGSHGPVMNGGNGGGNGARDARPWIMDKFKNIPMLQHAWKHAPDNDWYVLMDDDSYFFADNIGRWLDTLDPNKPYYLGSAVAGLQHVFAHGGSGIILSRGLMEMAFGDEHSDEWVDEYSERALKECCGDYVLAAFLKEKLDVGLNLAVSGKRFQGEDFANVAFNKHNWCSDIVSFHHTTSRNIELLWEYERIRGYSARARNNHVFSPQDGIMAARSKMSITYGDIYTDFVKPYMQPMRSMWDNGAKDFEYSWARDVKEGKANIDDYLRNDGFSDKPYTSVDKCRQACLAKADCLMFRYDPYQKYCGFSTSVSFGQPKTSYQDAEIKKLLKQHGIIQPARTKEDTMHSEWRFDRIESVRRKLSCDPPPEVEASDYDDGNEGWYWRAREKTSNSLLDEMAK